jgi:hypothetical protein
MGVLTVDHFRIIRLISPMPRIQTTFYNTGDVEYNDIVYTERTFDISENFYRFDLIPHTQYWRFGLVFSRTRDFEFVPSMGRYVNEDLRFFQINVGELLLNSGWSLPSRLEVATYYIKPSVLERTDAYPPLSPVRLFMVPSNKILLFHVRYGSSPTEISASVDGLTGYPYFRIFSWADYAEFNLDCIVEESAKFSSNMLEEPLPIPDSSFWVLKIREETWDIQTFKVGQQTWFTTHTLQSDKRPEYDQFLSIRPGDRIVAYAMRPLSASVAIMEVTEGVHSDLGKGEMISMVIREVLSPTVTLNEFASEISMVDKLSELSPTRLIRIGEKDFERMTRRRLQRGSTLYLPAFDSEGKHRGKQDQLDFADDIDSFAKVISLRSVQPPLAIGLFGNWGSGKSFFMENLSVRIDELKGSHSRYVNNVVHVNFNSWHYSDANLWASLITEIFDELFRFSKTNNKTDEVKKLTESLEIAVFQREAAEAKKVALERKQSELELDRNKKRDSLEDLTGLEILKLIISDKKVQEDLKAFDNEHVEEIFKNEKKVESFLAEVDEIRNHITYFFRELVRLRGRWVWVVSLAIIVAIVGWTVINLDLVAKTWELFCARLAQWVIPLGILAVRATRSLRSVNKQFKEAKIRLESLKSTFGSRPVNESEDLKQNRAALETARTDLQKINAKIEQVSQELDELRSGRKLLKFIEERHGDELYSRQLGLISLIRKDFKKLDELLRGQGQAMAGNNQGSNGKEAVMLNIERIVLYIDDLDRCSKDIVIRVLEAVNLLLAFELFVVIVGVDPRWLHQSLDKKYDFFTGQSVSPYEYLEKIFQIPFTLREIDQKGRGSLLRFLLQNEIRQHEQTSEREQANVATPNPGASTTVNQPSTTTSFIGQAPDRPPDNEQREEAKVEESSISISQTELSAIQKLSAVFGRTPRTMKRFVNIYRLVKAHRSFVATLDPRPTLLLLAIVVGHPEYTSDLMEALSTASQGSLSAFISGSMDLSQLIPLLDHLLKNNEWSSLDVQDLKANSALVSRFTFRSLETKKNPATPNTTDLGN